MATTTVRSGHVPLSQIFEPTYQGAYEIERKLSGICNIPRGMLLCIFLLASFASLWQFEKEHWSPTYRPAVQPWDSWRHCQGARLSFMSETSVYFHSCRWCHNATIKFGMHPLASLDSEGGPHRFVWGESGSFRIPYSLDCHSTPFLVPLCLSLFRFSFTSSFKPMRSSQSNHPHRPPQFCSPFRPTLSQEISISFIHSQQSGCQV